MDYTEALTSLMTALEGVCTDTVGIPFRQKNVGTQKLQEQYFLVFVDSMEPIGISDNFEYGKSAKQYEVFVDLACHRNHLPAFSGGTEVQLQRVLHSFEGHSGVYDKHFNNDTISFLRATRIQRRDFPIDKTQWEERSVMRLVFSMLVVEEDPVDVGWVETVQINKLKVYDAEDHVATESYIEVTYDGSYVASGYVETGYVNPAP